MVRIPSEYQEVEYIESTGGQYIDLPFGFDPTDKIETKFSITDSRSTDRYIVSPIEWNTNNNRFAMGVHAVYAVGFGGSTTSTTRFSPNTNNDGHIHEWHYSNRLFEIVDLGRSKDVSAIDFGSTTANLRLFYGYSTNTRGKIATYYHKKADGTKVNLIPCYRKSDNEIGMYDTVTKTFFTNQGTGTFLKGSDVNINYDNINLMESRRRILLNTPHLESASGSLVSFKTDVPANLKECKIHFTPVQEGEGTPSPDNVRPIHGWDGVTVTIPKGKNLLIPDDPDDPGANYYHTSTGSIKYSVEENGFYTDGLGVGYTIHARRTPTSLFIAPADMTVTFSVEYKNVNTTYGLRFYFNNARQSDIHGQPDGIWHKFSRTFTMQKGNYFTFIAYAGIYWRNIQIEIGSVASDYEEYITPNIIDVSFPQTIYGGYVDLVRGEVVEEWIYSDMGDCGWYKNWSAFVCIPTGINTHDGMHNLVNAISDIYPSGTITTASQINDTEKQIRGRNGYKHTAIKDSDYSEVADFITAVTGHQFVYKLATPNTYPLTPQTIKALRGLNNLWSNANGNLEVKFWKH